MECDFSESGILAKFVIGVIITGGGIIYTLLSIPFLIVNTTIDSSLRHILLSFQISNVVGGCIIMHDVMTVTCRTSDFNVVSISVLLTITHMILLLCAEHLILTSSVKRQVESFTGLICVSWLTSVSMGVTTAVTTTEGNRNVAQIVFSITMIVLLSLIYGTYVLLIRKNHSVRKKLLFFRKKQMKRDHFKNISMKRMWKLKYVTFVFVSYVAFGMPWLLHHLYEGASHRRTHKTVTFVVLVVYACNLYVLSSVCVYIWRKRRSKRIQPLEQNTDVAVDTA